MSENPIKTAEVALKCGGKVGKIQFHEFTLEQMCDHASILLIAKRGSGKSVLILDILEALHTRFPVGLVIAPTDRMNKFYSNSCIPDSYVHYNFKTEIIQNVLKRQIKMKEKKTKSPNVNSNGFIVMDDCLSQKADWARDPAIFELLYNGRHYDITYILSMQYPLGISPDLRQNFDYVFLLSDDIVENQKKLWKYYAGCFPSFDSFRQVFTQLTTDFGCMVLSNRGHRTNLQDKVFHYKARILNLTKHLGCQQYNFYHNKNYNKDWLKKNNLFGDNNLENYLDNKNKSGKKKIIVETIKQHPNNDTQSEFNQKKK